MVAHNHLQRDLMPSTGASEESDFTHTHKINKSFKKALKLKQKQKTGLGYSPIVELLLLLLCVKPWLQSPVLLALLKKTKPNQTKPKQKPKKCDLGMGLVI